MAVEKDKSIFLRFRVYDYNAIFFHSYRMNVSSKAKFGHISQLLARAILKPKVEQKFEFMKMTIPRDKQVLVIYNFDTPESLNLKDEQNIDVFCEYIQINYQDFSAEENFFKILDPDWIFGIKLEKVDFEHVMKDKYHFLQTLKE